MADRYEKIRKALKMGPTPGPWRVCPTNSGTFVKSERVSGYLAEVRHCRTAQDVKADAHLIAACNPDTIRELLEERDALAREKEALKRCAIMYLGWLGVTHIPLDQALHADMRNPSVCGDAALSKENSND